MNIYNIKHEKILASFLKFVRIEQINTEIQIYAHYVSLYEKNMRKYSLKKYSLCQKSIHNVYYYIEQIQIVNTHLLSICYVPIYSLRQLIKKEIEIYSLKNVSL